MKRLAHFLMAGALLLLAASPALAQGEDLTQNELISLVGDAVVEEATQSSAELAKAKEVLDAVRNRKNAPQKDVADAQMDYEQAQDRYNRAQSNLDNAKVDQLALRCGKSSDQIRAMRDSGMGWGRIAKECGAHGVGKAKGKNKDKAMKKNQSMEQETVQDMGDAAQGKGKSKNKKPKKK